jgi:hypothetical protein
VTLAISVDDLGGSGKLTATDDVPIIVTPANDAPVNTVPAAQFVKTNANSFSFSTATGNAIAIADGDSGTNPLLVTLTVDQGTLLVNSAVVTFTAGANNTAAATLTFSGTLANLNAALQTLVYTPPANFQGTATLTVTTDDQGGTSPDGTLNDARTTTSTVSITVTAANLAPVIIVPAVAPTVPATDVGAPGQLAFTGANAIQVRDDDAGTNPVTVNLSVNQGSLTVFGNTFADGDTATATDSIANINTFLAGMTYTPLVGFQGPVTLTITVNDNGNTGPGGPQTTTATVTINVGSRTPPTAQAPAKQSTTQGARLTFSSATGNNFTVSTASTEVVNLQVTVTAAHGTVTLPDASKLFFTVGDGIADRTMTFSGSPVDINAALDGLVYVPDANFQGSDFLTVTVADPEEQGDLTPQPPHDIEADGGDDGDPPQAATNLAGASSSSAAQPASLLSATTTVLINVNDGALTAGTLTPPAASEGQAVNGAVLFHFSDADPSAVVSDFTATVSWGDGTTQSSATSANVQVVANASGGFDVVGSHTYGEEASGLTFTVGVQDNGGAAPISASSSMKVGDAALTAGKLTPPSNPVLGAPTSSQVLFHFSDANGNATAADFTATVSWGDGRTETSTGNPADVSVRANPQGGFDVIGRHTFTQGGSLAFAVAVADIGGSTASRTSTLTVGIGPSVSVAFGPFGQVVELVSSAGMLTQVDALGAHVLGGGVRAASVSFYAGSEVLLVTYQSGALAQFDAFGTHLLGGGGVLSASVAFSPFGEVIELVDVHGNLTQYDALGAHFIGGGVRSASVAFGPAGEVLVVTFAGGGLAQYDAAGAHALGGNVLSAGVAIAPDGSEVLDVIFGNLALYQFDAAGARLLGQLL